MMMRSISARSAERKRKLAALVIPAENRHIHSCDVDDRTLTWAEAIKLEPRLEELRLNVEAFSRRVKRNMPRKWREVMDCFYDTVFKPSLSPLIGFESDSPDKRMQSMWGWDLAFHKIWEEIVEN